MTNPTDGRVTSLQVFAGQLSATALLSVVSPGNAAQGVNYGLPFINLATNIAATILPNAATGTILFGQGVSTAPSFVAVAGDLAFTSSSAIATATIATHAVTLAKIQQVTGLSVAGVAGTATADLAAITGTTDQVLRVAANGTTLGFGAINLTAAALTGVMPVPFGGSGTSTLTAAGVIFGNGTATVGITAAGATALPLTATGGTAAPTFSVLTVPGGGTGTTTLTVNRVLIGNGTTTLALSNVATTGFALVGNGTSAAPGFAVLGVPGGGLGTGATTPFAVLLGGTTATSQVQSLATTGASGLVLTSQGSTVPPTWLVAGVGTQRELLAADRTYYVRTDGSNSNNGLTNSSGGAFLTIQFALDLVRNTLDLAGHTVTVQLGNAGTYGTVTLIDGPNVGAGSIILRGDPAAASTFLLSTTGDTIIVQSGAVLYITGVKIASSAGYGVRARYGSFVRLTNFEVGTCAIIGLECDNAQLFVGDPAVANSGNYTISGGGAGHLHFINSGVITLVSGIGTASGTPAFSTYFAGGANAGVVSVGTFSYTSAATGKRFLVHQNANVTTPTGIGDLSFFPGDVAGTIDSGGQYNDFFDFIPIAWTPSDASGAGLTFSSVSCNYSIVGNMVHVYGSLTYPSTANGAGCAINGLPVIVANANFARQGFVTYCNSASGAAFVLSLANTSTIGGIFNNVGAPLTNANMSGSLLMFEMIYPKS